MEIDDLAIYALDNGYPDNDSDPIGGDIDAEWTDGSDVFFNGVRIDAAGGTDRTYYATGAVGVKTGASGTLESPVVYNRSGAIPNTFAGAVSVQGTHADDDGDLRVHGKIGGVWDWEDIAVAGLSLSAGSKTFDAGSVRIGEYIKDDAAAKPVGTLRAYCGGENFLTVRGTGKPQAVDVGAGEFMATSIFKLAVCSAKNTALTWASDNNRTEAPNNVGTFEYADFDNPVDSPSDLVAEDELHFCLEFDALSGLPETLLGYLTVDVAFGGDPA